MKIYDSFSYGTIKLLNGKTPVGLGTALNILILTIEDPRVLVWRHENENDVTNIGALQFIHSTGEVYSIKKNRTVFYVPKNRIPVILSHIDNRIAKDKNRLRIKQLKETIKSKFNFKQK